MVNVLVPAKAKTENAHLRAIRNALHSGRAQGTVFDRMHVWDVCFVLRRSVLRCSTP